MCVHVGHTWECELVTRNVSLSNSGMSYIMVLFTRQCSSPKWESKAALHCSLLNASNVQTKELPTFSNPVYQTHQVVKSWREITSLSTENGSCQSHVHRISSLKCHPQIITYTVDCVFALRKYVGCLIDIWKSSIRGVLKVSCFNKNSSKKASWSNNQQTGLTILQ